MLESTDSIKSEHPEFLRMLLRSFVKKIKRNSGDQIKKYFTLIFTGKGR